MTIAHEIDAHPLEDAFRHEALFYSGMPGFLEGTIPFIREGLDAQGAILLVIGAAKIDALRCELGPDARRVTFADMGDVGHNPARIIPAWQDFVDAKAVGGRRLWGIGEPIWAERSADELVESQRHESLVNLAFADGAPWRLLCPYDTSSLEADVLDEAYRSHPYVWESGFNVPSATYRTLDSVAAPFDEPLPDPPAHTEEIAFTGRQLPALRRFVAARAPALGLDPDDTEAFVLAVNEVATNSLRYGGGCGRLILWKGETDVVCEVQDRGYIDEPMAGRERPVAEQEGGFGLWIANQVCDLVQMRTFPGGSVVRLHMSVG